MSQFSVQDCGLDDREIGVRFPTGTDLHPRLRWVRPASDLRCVYTRGKFEVRQVEAERMHKWRRNLRQPRPIRRAELRNSGLSQLESVHQKRGSSEATRMHPLVETGIQGSAVLRCVRSGRGHFLSSASCVRKVSVERGICSASTASLQICL
jgi:hypothetical protein